jgi:hypothetical protein
MSSIPRPQLYYSLCPTLCRSAAEIAYHVSGGRSIPRPGRIKLVLSHVLNRWPEPVTGTTLSKALGMTWPGEALKLLWPLARAGILSVEKVRGKFLFFRPE